MTSSNTRRTTALFAFLVVDAGHAAGEVHDLLARQDFTGSREAAQTGREIKGAPAPALRDCHRLAGVQPDSDRERQ
jgi:hypothetical protein